MSRRRTATEANLPDNNPRPRRNPRRAVRGLPELPAPPAPAPAPEPRRDYRPNDLNKRHRLPSRHGKTETVTTYKRRKPL